MTARNINDRVIEVYPMTFRNDCGMAFVGPKLKRIRYGLFPGSADRVGWRPIVITSDMVGQTIAQFLSVEIKTARDRMSDEQKRWASAVVRDGGRAEIWKETPKGLEVIVWPNE